MQNCNCYSCKPNLVPDGYNGTKCSICKIPTGTFPAVPYVGSVCLKCLDNRKPIEDPIYKVKFPRCSCGDIVHVYNMLYHGGFSAVGGHHIDQMSINMFKREMIEARKNMGDL